jgi:hypothetical protein
MGLGKPASLLAAFADTPLRVEGRLESLDRGQVKYRKSNQNASACTKEKPVDSF